MTYSILVWFANAVPREICLMYFHIEYSPEGSLPNKDWNLSHVGWHLMTPPRLATYMKHEWLKRCITNWKNIEMLYHDKDFKISGKAAHLNALINLEAVYDEECKKMANKYSRKVFDYTNLAG